VAVFPSGSAWQTFHVDMLDSWYKFVNFGAEHAPVPTSAPSQKSEGGQAVTGGSSGDAGPASPEVSQQQVHRADYEGMS